MLVNQWVRDGDGVEWWWLLVLAKKD